MQNHKFLSEVRRRTGAASDGEAMNITRGVLQTLADHLAGNTPAKVAAQLPEEIGALLTEYKNDPDADGEGFDVEEFVRRTTERGAASDTETAKSQTKAVFAVLREAVSEGEFDKTRGTFPDEYEELFGSDFSDFSTKIIGMWKLVSLETIRPSGEIVYDWMGRHPTGLIIYDVTGRMAVQIMRDPRPTFASNVSAKATPEEKEAAFEGYYAYFGTFEFNEEEGLLTHRVQNSLYPNEVGINYTQSFNLSDSRLILATAPYQEAGEQRTNRITWERVK